MMAEESLTQLRKRPHWSYSSINTFLNICSLQWAFRYVYGHEPSFTPAPLVFGGTFHRVLEFVSRQRMDGETIDSAQALGLFGDLLTQASGLAEPQVRYAEGEDIDSAIGTGTRMLEAYLALPPGETVTGVSVPFCVELADAGGNALGKPLIGEFDLVVEQNGTAVIVDWKTSARRWPNAKVQLDLQPTCYLHAYRRMHGNAPVTFRFEVITKTKTPAVQQCPTIRHPDHVHRLVEQVKVAEKMIRSELFLPNDQSWACGGCPYGLSCQAWHKDRARSLYIFTLAA